MSVDVTLFVHQRDLYKFPVANKSLERQTQQPAGQAKRN